MLPCARGALSVSSGKTTEFMLAGIALMLAANVRSEIEEVVSSDVGTILVNILENVYVVAAAATLVLAIKTLVVAAREGKQ